MDPNGLANPPALPAGDAVAEADQPLLTYYDDATGERTGLSAVALGEWASRTARLLHEGCGLGVGHRAAVLLPAHWQTAAVTLGAWSAGLTVSFRLWATAGLTAHGPGEDEPLDAVFVAADRVDSWLDDVPEARHRFVVGLQPGTDPVPPGYRDHLAELDRYPEGMPGYSPIRRGDPASVDGTTFGQWGTLARELADAVGLHPGDRVLIDANEHEHPVKWLLAPLAVGGAVVLCANLDPAVVDARVAAERVTRTWVAPPVARTAGLG